MTSNDRREALKPCPFCGAEPYSMPVFNSWGVACSEGCCGFEDASQEEAERQWQARAPIQITDGPEESLSDFRTRYLRRCSPNVTPQEYMMALDDLEYVHPESEAALNKAGG